MDQEAMHEDRPYIANVAKFFHEVLNFLRENTAADEEIACLLLSDTSSGNFWINGTVTSKVWQDGMLKMATKIVDGQMYHHIAISAKLITETLQEQKLKATEVKGQPS